MIFAQVILGCLLILVLFNIGESTFTRLKMGKWVLVIFLVLSFCLTFVPNINFWKVSVSPSIFPAMLLSIYFLFFIKNLRNLGRYVLSLLFIITLSLLFSSVGIYVDEYVFLSSAYLLALAFGMVVEIITKSLTSCFSSLFFGLVISEFIKFGVEFSGVGYSSFELNSNNILSMILVGTFASCFTFFFERKIVLIKKRRERKRAEKMVQN